MFPIMFYLEMIDSPENKLKFEEIYIEYRGLMYHVAYEIVKNIEDAEDAVHQAFVAVIENIEKVEPVCAQTKSFVVTVVERKAIDTQRKITHRREVEYNEENVGLQIDYDGSFQIAACLTKLPARYKHILALKYRYGFKNKEIARMMGISEANAIKLDQRAKEKFFELCRQEGIL